MKSSIAAVFLFVLICLNPTSATAPYTMQVYPIRSDGAAGLCVCNLQTNACSLCPIIGSCIGSESCGYVDFLDRALQLCGGTTFHSNEQGLAVPCFESRDRPAGTPYLELPAPPLGWMYMLRIEE